MSTPDSSESLPPGNEDRTLRGGGPPVDPGETQMLPAGGVPARPYLGETLAPSEAPPAPAPSVVPGYEILAELGRGGMGVVFKARQAELDRMVALKMILAGPHASAQELSRFRSEARAAARLCHSNIVQIYHVGDQAGLAFFAMEYAEGGSLADRLDGTPWPGREAAALVRILAAAVQHAHEQGVIHRDLKPANVLLGHRQSTAGGQPTMEQRPAGNEGRRPVTDWVPKIADFGLAKRLDLEGPTVTGQLLGTPGYMAPEQADSRLYPVGPGTDVWALGAILYELLTGRPPFVAETPLDSVMRVLSEDPVPPRLLNSKVDHDLETICLKCLEKDPRQRYCSAQELADDLTRFLNGDNIEARSINLLSRVARALEGREHAPEFRNWSTLVLLLAGIIFLGHLLIFLFLQSGLPGWTDWLARTLQLILAALVFWRCRPHTILPGTAAERLLWTIWIGYFLAYFSGVVLKNLLLVRGIVVRGPAGPEHLDELLLYPFLALLGGLSFFVMGSAYWGRYYTIGIVFLVIAALMPLWLEGAPLVLGTAWGICLVLIAFHLRRLGKEAEREPKAP